MSGLMKAGKQDTQKTARRKRVNRLKRIIIGVVIILLFLSVILNFILACKVLRLEEKVNHLYSKECDMKEDLYV